MSERVFARKIQSGLWQWRSVKEGRWVDDYYHTGDDEALAGVLPGASLPATLIVMGQQAVSEQIPIPAKDKKHMAKLLPYEMEESLIENIEDLHFVFSANDDDSAAVAYTRSESLRSVIENLEQLGCDVQQCIADYFLLKREPGGATLVYDENLLFAHLRDNHGFVIEASLAPRVLASLAQKYQFSSTLNIVAENQQKLDVLKQWLPAEWLSDDELDGANLVMHESSFWEWVDPSLLVHPLDLRRGLFARRMPLARWWDVWKVPAVAVMCAYVLAVIVGFGQYLDLNSQRKNVVDETNRVYQEAVPNGRKGDPLGTLQSMVKNLGGESSSTNLMPLFNAVSLALKDSSDVVLSSFRYNGDQRELRLNIETTEFAKLESLRAAVNQQGLSAELLRVSAQGDKHQARMKVVEASQ